MLSKSNLLTVSHLSFVTNKKQILKKISFAVPEGSLCAFVGSNGAGKTTTIKCIVGLYPYKEGKIMIDGIDEKNYKSKFNLAYVPEKENFPKVKVKRFFEQLNAYFPLDNKKTKKFVEKIMRLFGISELLNSYLPRLSSGQKKKILIIQALFNKANLIVMDEPTENMDPDARDVFYQIIEYLKKKGKTIFISTHNLDEIGKHLNYVVIIKSGRIKFSGVPSKKSLFELYKQYTDKNKKTVGKKAVEKVFNN